MSVFEATLWINEAFVFFLYPEKKKKKPYEINPSTEINSDSVGLCYRGCCYM